WQEGCEKGSRRTLHQQTQISCKPPTDVDHLSPGRNINGQVRVRDGQAVEGLLPSQVSGAGEIAHVVSGENGIAQVRRRYAQVGGMPIEVRASDSLSVCAGRFREKAREIE